MNKETSIKGIRIRIFCAVLAALTVFGIAFYGITRLGAVAEEENPLDGYKIDVDNRSDIYISCGILYGDGAESAPTATTSRGFVVGSATITTGRRSFEPLFMLEGITSVSFLPLSFLCIKDGKLTVCEKEEATVLPYRVELASDKEDIWLLKSEIEEAVPEAKDMFSVKAMANGVRLLRYGGFADAAAASVVAGEFEALLAEKNISVNISIPTGTGSYLIDNASQSIIFEFDSFNKNNMPALFPMRSESGGVGSTTLSNGFNYYDPICFSRSDSKFNVINLVELNTYVQGVLPSEIYASWPMEVQKAFAIIVRSYSICSIGGRHFGSYNFDICNTTCCQVYRGRYRVNDNVIIAVNETGYKVITSGGRAVSAAYYSAIHGGESTNAAFVWGGSNPPHIAAQKTPWEEYTKYPQNHGYWTMEFTPAELTLQLRSKGYTDVTEPIAAISVNSRAGSSNFVYHTTYTDLAGNVQAVSRTAKNYGALGAYSANYDIAFDSVDYYLDTVISVDVKRHTSEEKKPVISLFNVLTGNGLFASSNVGASVLTSDGVSLLPQNVITVLTENGTSTLKGAKFHASEPDENGIYTAVNVYGDTVITTVLKREYYTLKASAPGNIVIAGKGWGHGLGMSQYGARDLAVFGAEYDQIIHAYYADVEIISLK